MKALTKRILTLAVMAIMVLSVAVGLAGCEDKEENFNGKEVIVGDFSLTVTVDKTEVQRGKTISVTAVFKNLSGKDISIELTDWQTYYYLSGQVEATPLEIVVCPNDSEWGHISIGVESRHRMLIEKDAIFQQTVEYRIDEAITHKAIAGVFFYIGEGYTEFFTIKSESIKIKVK